MATAMCAVERCGRPVAGNGLCKLHWQRHRRTGSTEARRKPTLEERFWERVDRSDPTGCWPWTGARFSTGYGVFHIDRQSRGAHRVAYELAVGPIPEGRQLDHLCRVRHCVNPAHLEPVTAKTNLLRGETKAAANAAKTHCPQGHPYDETNTYITPAGHRACRECLRARWRLAHPPAGTKRGPKLKERCAKGHPMSGHNLYVSSKGKRVCIACRQERDYRAALKKKAKKA